MRLDCCSDLEVKYRMGQGAPGFRPDFKTITFGDPRSFDLVYEFPRDSLPVWRRPWVEAQVLEGYPVEYRAYVRDGELRGISNYYPQRALPRFDLHLERVREYTQRLIKAANPPFLWHETLLWMSPQDPPGPGGSPLHRRFPGEYPLGGPVPGGRSTPRAGSSHVLPTGRDRGHRPEGPQPPAAGVSPLKGPESRFSGPLTASRFSPVELREAAEHLGLGKYVQYPGSWKEHLDVSESKRRQAIRRLGAREATSREIASMLRVRREAPQQEPLNT